MYDFKLFVTALNYPRFFTPNGDSFNDIWNIKGLTKPKKALFIFLIGMVN